jgi:hypothetical protein
LLAADRCGGLRRERYPTVFLLAAHLLNGEAIERLDVHGRHWRATATALYLVQPGTGELAPVVRGQRVRRGRAIVGDVRVLQEKPMMASPRRDHSGGVSVVDRRGSPARYRRLACAFKREFVSRSSFQVAQRLGWRFGLRGGVALAAGWSYVPPENLGRVTRVRHALASLWTRAGESGATIPHHDIRPCAPRGPAPRRVLQ